jgi:hypothetical protein
VFSLQGIWFLSFGLQKNYGWRPKKDLARYISVALLPEISSSWEGVCSAFFTEFRRIQMLVG